MNTKVANNLVKARRVNQAYQTYYGPAAKVTDAFTRDMAADKVVERRSWFPTMATAYFLSSPYHNVKRRNIQLTKGFEMKDRERMKIGTRLKPGQLVQTSEFGTMDNSPAQGNSDGHTILYVTIIVIGIVLISMFI